MRAGGIRAIEIFRRPQGDDFRCGLHSRRVDIDGIARLIGHEPLVHTIGCHQGAMVATFHHPAVIQGQNAVAVNHARQAVGQDQHRTILHQSVQSFLNHRFILSIDSG